LTDGTEVKTDLVLIGTGISPTTEFLKESNIDRDQFGGVICNPFL
jgi:NAD(P)H-nitrite reductase large subunit